MNWFFRFSAFSAVIALVASFGSVICSALLGGIFLNSRFHFELLFSFGISLMSIIFGSGLFTFFPSEF